MNNSGNHNIFKNNGTSIYVKTQKSSKYSEANAGSGEVAVIQLVKRIQESKLYSLILLDEPEVSIHPSAQEKLKLYLLKQIMEKQLQVIISTHSPVLIQNMPNESLKLFITDIATGKFEVQENVSYLEAFFDIEEYVPGKKIIFCEDKAAKYVIEKVLLNMKKSQYFEVQYIPGGEKTLVTKHIPSYTTNTGISNNTFMILDGDMDQGYQFDKNNCHAHQIEDAKFLSNCVKQAYGAEINVYVDGHKGVGSESQKCLEYMKYLES